jgi:histidine triad (HIT) family protein
LQAQDCIFCKIVRKELPSYLVFEDENFIAFLDIRPLNPGHTLVSPKKHHRWVWDVPEAGGYFETVRMIAKALQKEMNTEWIVADIGGMGVAHAHVHVVPRFAGDGHGEFVNPKNVKDIPPDQMKKLAERIRSGLHRANAE